MSSAAVEPAKSASAITAVTLRGHHVLKIDGYSLTKETPTGVPIKSRQFIVGGHRWCIWYYPNGECADSADYVSLYLVLDETVTKAVKAKSMFSLAGSPPEKQTPSTWETVYLASRGYTGSAKFIEREALEQSEHLKDDSFAVRCDVVVVKDCNAEDSIDVVAPTVPPSDLHVHLGDLLETGKGADVVFEVGGETFAAHRWLLAARSPVFGAELFGVMKEGDTRDVIHVRDMEPHVFKALLYFAYTDTLSETREEDENAKCQHLLVAADRYAMERLKAICEHKLCEHIDAGTVGTILALAELHHCDGLKRACFDFLGSPTNVRAVMATDGFDYLSISCPSVLKELITICSAPATTSVSNSLIGPKGTKRARVNATVRKVRRSAG